MQFWKIAAQIDLELTAIRLFEDIMLRLLAFAQDYKRDSELRHSIAATRPVMPGTRLHWQRWGSDMMS